MGKSKLVSATDNYLIELINAATTSIDFVGTGLSISMAKAIIEKKNIVKSLVVDNDEMVYRFGYGDIGALDLLIKNKVPNLRTTKNIRINIIAVDDVACVYTPNPLAIEDKIVNNQPNGVMVDYNSIADVFEKVGCCHSDRNNQQEALVDDTLMVTELTDKAVQENVVKIKENPPRFDLSKTLFTYNAKVQFVEIQLRGVNVTRHTLKIPKELLRIAGKDKILEDKLKATYTIFSKDGEIDRCTKVIQEKMNELRSNYTVSIKKCGQLFALCRKEALKNDLKNLNDELLEMKQGIRFKLEQEMEDSKNSISNMLFPLVKENPPDDLVKKVGVVNDRVIKQYIDKKLDKAFKSPEEFLDDMKIEVVYKDVTLEMLQDQEFIDAVNDSDLSFCLNDDAIMTSNIAAPKV